MVYIYGLVIAGYLVLGFISRGDGMPGFYKMAAFICQKAGRTGIGKNAGRIPNESVVRRDLAILYPFGQTKREEERFYTERIRIVLMILLAGDILAIASYAAAGRSLLMTEQGELIRDQVGGEDRVTELEASVQDKGGTEEEPVYQENYRLEVRSRKYSREQAEQMAEKLFKELPDLMAGQNSDLRHVTSDLVLPDAVEGYPFVIAWESSSYALVDADGTVGNVAMEKNASREVTLTAILSYDNGTSENMRFDREYAVTVYPPVLSLEEKMSAGIREALSSADEKSVSEEVLPLPKNLEDRTVNWREKPSDAGPAVILFALAVAFLTVASMGSRLHQRVVDRERQMMLDYPQIISKFVLYMGAGLSIRSSFIKIGEDYGKKREAGGKERGAYEEILLVCRELGSGVPEPEAYARFGVRCRSRQYTRLCTLLTQNIKKGNQELLSVMQQEAQASFEERRSTARRLGEEAETKLLLPMVLMLAITMLIIIIPAYYSFAA